MIFGMDKSFTIIATLDDTLLSAVATVEINKQSLLDFSVPIEEALSENIKYFAIPYPNRDTGVMVFEYSSKEDDGDTTTYSAAELAYNELATDNYITDRRPETQSASALLKLALEGSNWTISTANVGTQVHTNFYYVSNLEAINSVVTAGGGEIIFYMDVVGNKITGRHIDYLLQQGDDNGAWFEWDDEVLSIDRKEERTQMYSRILPRGKGELLEGEEEADTPDGYGRRITIKDVVWKKPANPLDKAKGAIILENPDATKLYPNLSGKGKLLIKIYEDIDQPEQLIQQAYTDLMASSRPLVQYSADVAEVGSLSLGDAVTISHPNPLLSFKTRVFKVEFDLVDPLNSKVSLGDNLADNDIISQLNDLSSQATANSDMTNWTHHNGDRGTSYGTAQPKNPKKGDVWFKLLPNGKTELYYFDGSGWALSAKTDSQWEQNRAVTLGNHTTYYGAVDPRKDPANNVKEGDVWFDTPENSTTTTTHRFIKTAWVAVNGLGDGHGLYGAIDGNQLAIENISASNITTGHLSANFIRGGQIDAFQINVININVNTLVGNTADFGGVHIDPEKIVLATADPVNPAQNSSLTLMGGSMIFSNSTSNIDKTMFNNYGLNLHRRGTAVNSIFYSVGVYGGGFYPEKAPYNSSPGIIIGDGVDNKAENMTWGLSIIQGTGAAPQLIWAGANSGKITSLGGPSWDNPQGWIIPENLRFSTWDHTASVIWLDDTTRFRLESQEIVINQHLQGGGISTMKIGNYVLGGNNAWVGWTDGGSQAGFGVDGSGDVWIMIKGQFHSMYALINKVGGV